MVIKAICVLAGDVVKGVVNLTQHTPDCPVEIKGEITGLKEGLHGFHIHEFGDNSNGCTSAGGHFNPSGADHGSPDDCESHRHAGDLGNVNADCSGVAKIDLQDVGITLYGKNSIVGRSAVVHAEEDDLGKGCDPESKVTGKAGSRLACGVIGYALNKPDPEPEYPVKCTRPEPPKCAEPPKCGEWSRTESKESRSESSASRTESSESRTESRASRIGAGGSRTESSESRTESSESRSTESSESRTESRESRTECKGCGK